MPFINGRYYMNPAYGRAVERARLRAVSAENREPEEVPASATASQQGPGEDGHWVTIDYRHVFIHQGSRANPGRRARIADIARKHAGDTSLPYKPGHPTCNIFVQGTIAESGAPKPPVKKADGTPGAPSAAEWAGSPVPGWRFLQPGETPQPGDVAARKENFPDATGHSGIVVAVSKDGVVTAIAAHAHEIGPDMTFQTGPHSPNVFRRYTGD